jgi:hypothetical protein
MGLRLLLCAPSGSPEEDVSVDVARIHVARSIATFPATKSKVIGASRDHHFLVVVLIIAPMLIDNGFNTRLSGVFN